MEIRKVFSSIVVAVKIALAFAGTKKETKASDAKKMGFVI